jgi:hypothetical protein
MKRVRGWREKETGEKEKINYSDENADQSGKSHDPSTPGLGFSGSPGHFFNKPLHPGLPSCWRMGRNE